MSRSEQGAGLTREEAHEVSERLGLRSLQVFEIVRQEGVEELSRPVNSLFWSGIAAGLALSLSVYCTAFLHHALRESPLQSVLESLGYSVGFVIVILGRLQLFTENTITVVLPVLSDCSRFRIQRTARLWAIVFAANMIGTLISALVATLGGIVPPVQLEAALAVSHHLLEYSALQTLLYGIPAGFMVASIVWSMPSAKGSELGIIVLITSMIALGGLTHVVAGSTEWFLLALAGEMSWAKAVLAGILPAFVGNVIGGTGLFALITYAQVKDEI
ncbi:formate/nitrite transporter family protein [Thiocystis violacea]|uniref:formate/nitrite transporter family protein n=1 Tax=Thiocystis violacea TaxID=13725 RepID=UPI0019058F5A|nr:formate/nitrite transporter family protein [Thiocystis violacea]MBK1725126.1 transporter (formate/nitrite transporter family protein) [Thiocystis violacea]